MRNPAPQPVPGCRRRACAACTAACDCRRRTEASSFTGLRPPCLCPEQDRSPVPGNNISRFRVRFNPGNSPERRFFRPERVFLPHGQVCCTSFGRSPFPLRHKDGKPGTACFSPSGKERKDRGRPLFPGSLFMAFPGHFTRLIPSHDSWIGYASAKRTGPLKSSGEARRKKDPGPLKSSGSGFRKGPAIRSRGRRVRSGLRGTGIRRV